MLVAFPVVSSAQVREGVGAVELFRLAGEAQAEDRLADAETIYRALIQDRDAEVRAEARFRLGMLLAAQGRNRDAALAFRRLLDEKPDAARVRIELARVLALIGDEAAARREIRQAQAIGLPSDVALVVDQFANALRARKPIGGSLSFAFVPDSNINRATDAETLDTVVAPLTLSEDARSQSGVGIRLGGQGYARLPVGDRLTLLPRVSAQAELYRRSQFNDISASVALGLEAVGERSRFRPSIAQTVRFYGGDLYAQTRAASINWVRALGRRAQLDVTGTVGRADYRLNDLQDGWLFDLSAAYERAFDARSGGSLSLAANRQTARDPGYATTAGGASLLYWRDLGRVTLFGTAGVRRLESDARLFPFDDRRREWLYSAGAGGTFRQLTVSGFAPVVRVSWERNASTVGIYDYRRFAVDFGITRAF